MINFSTYKQVLLNEGRNISEIRRKQSRDIVNITFAEDPEYRRVYILDDTGWHFEDAKYQKHATPSILKDNVDHYLQFRPRVHYKIGSYVIVPDEANDDVTVPLKNPFEQPVDDRTQWWIIVGKTDEGEFVRYSILQCNWEFKWIYNGSIRRVFGVKRAANSYTSGSWSGDILTSLDNITNAWIPDIYYVYGKKMKEFNLDDTRTLNHEMRFMISDNYIYPKTYMLTKVKELEPAGIIKLTLTQKPYDEKRDNVELRICDYYDDSGEPVLTIPTKYEDIPKDPVKECHILWMELNEDDELVFMEDSDKQHLSIAKTSYFKADFNFDYHDRLVWDILINDPDDELDDDRKQYLCKLLQFTDFEDGSISIRPSRAGILKGHTFTLAVSDKDGLFLDSIEMEVTE